MKLYLVRHGETDWNLANRIQGHTDIPLNENGRQQAKALAQRLAEEHQIDVIYSSKQKRALETAQIIGAKLEIEPIPTEGLQEVCLGSWEGYTWRQVRELFPEEYEAWYKSRRYLKPPCGESYQQVLDRVLPVLMQIWLQEEGNALIVTHGAVIMSLLSYLHNTPFEDMARNYKTGNTGVHELAMEELKKRMETDDGSNL